MSVGQESQPEVAMLSSLKPTGGLASTAALKVSVATKQKT